MARIRSIKPEFWDDRKLARLVSRDARMLYIGLWNQADEHARCNGDPHWIKGRVFPYDDDLTDDHVAGLLGELVDAGRVVAYQADGDPYLLLPKLGAHQRLEPKVDSKLPDPPEPDPAGRPEPASGSTQPARDPDKPARDPDEPAPDAGQPAPHADKSALLYVAGSMEHGAGVGGRAQARARPTQIPKDFELTDDMRDWARSKGILGNLQRETDRFRDYWLGAGKPKADWLATWRNWVSKEADDTRNQTIRRSISSAYDDLPTEDQRVAAWEAEKRRTAADAHRLDADLGGLLGAVGPAYGGAS